MVRPLIVIGAGGRIGRLLQLVWRREAVWLGRAEWDILTRPALALPQGAVILDLAGVIRGDVGLNSQLADAVGRMARATKAQVIHLSSASVYPGGPADMTEATTPAPPSPYGESKLVAEAVLRGYLPDALILRVGNIAGADAVLGPRGPGEIVLDPVPNGGGGPVRSYIGPLVLARALADLCDHALRGDPLPPLMNLSQPGPVAMACLMDAAGLEWRFGPLRDGVLARVALSTALQSTYLTLPEATAPGLVDELRAVKGWP